jgi:hypothetical protein
VCYPKPSFNTIIELETTQRSHNRQPPNDSTNFNKNPTRVHTGCQYAALPSMINIGCLYTSTQAFGTIHGTRLLSTFRFLLLSQVPAYLHLEYIALIG